MEFIVHIGTPKTGTSALQSALTANRDLLAQNGVIYPPGFPGKHNHKGLAAALRVGKKQLTRTMVKAYADRPMRRETDYEDFFVTLRSQIEQSTPEAVVVSSEAFWGTRDDQRLAEFADRLRSLGGTVHFVAYVRDPGDHYLSSVQQKLKASHIFLKIRERPWLERLERFSEIGDKMTVCAFQRSTLAKGDITADFLTRFFPQKTGLASLASPVTANETHSAEAMDIIQRHRLKAFPDQPDVSTRETKELRKRLTELDRLVGGEKRPRLHDHVREDILSRNYGLAEIRDRWGVHLDKVDYAKTATSMSPPWEPKRVGEICKIDPHRLEEIERQLGNRASRP